MPSATGSTRNVRRWMVWVAVLLLTGALINVAVAWGFAVWSRVNRGTPTISNRVRPWHSWVPADWPPPDLFETVEGPGYRVDASIVQLAGGPEATQGHSYGVTTLHSGWPFRCLGWTYWQHNVVLATAPIMTGLPPRSSWWHWGMPMPDWIGRSHPDWERFPARPVPLPFVANSLFYAAALAAPVLGVPWLRKRLRKRPGHCGRCGYDLRDLPTGARCPECGAEAIG